MLKCFTNKRSYKQINLNIHMHTCLYRIYIHRVKTNTHYASAQFGCGRVKPLILKKVCLKFELPWLCIPLCMPSVQQAQLEDLINKAVYHQQNWHVTWQCERWHQTEGKYTMLQVLQTLRTPYFRAEASE